MPCTIVGVHSPCPRLHLTAASRRQRWHSTSIEGTFLHISNIAFFTTDWSKVQPTEHPGVTGVALWRTVQAGDIRVRLVEYTPGYVADHWCSRGHILLVLEGTLITELQDGRRFELTPMTSYQVADHDAPHKSSTLSGARLFIVD